MPCRIYTCPQASASWKRQQKLTPAPLMFYCLDLKISFVHRSTHFHSLDSKKTLGFRWPQRPSYYFLGPQCYPEQCCKEQHTSMLYSLAGISVYLLSYSFSPLNKISTKEVVYFSRTVKLRGKAWCSGREK